MKKIWTYGLVFTLGVFACSIGSDYVGKVQDCSVPSVWDAIKVALTLASIILIAFMAGRESQ